MVLAIIYLHVMGNVRRHKDNILGYTSSVNNNLINSKLEKVYYYFLKTWSYKMGLWSLISRNIFNISRIYYGT